MASASSANAGSNALSGKSDAGPDVLPRALERKEVREEGRRGVVGREREVERVRDARGTWHSSGVGVMVLLLCCPTVAQEIRVGDTNRLVVVSKKKKK